ncbi:MAG: N-acetylmuramoyl-L-alanine amidase, partial [Clostridia bacterium]|nr:N-acetylmuramoyl-L-alanine amidase [Clostridia bacterium]
MTTEETIWRFLRDRIGNPRGAAGLMGNLCAESGLNPRNLQGTYEKALGMTDSQYTAKVDDGSYTGFATDRAGYGLAQWTYPARKEALLQYAKARGVSIGDLNMQLEFLIHEMQTDFRGAWEALRSALTVREASDAVMLKFERPKNQSEENQIKRAQMGVKYYEQYGREGGNMNRLKIYRRYLTKSSCYQSGARITPMGVQVHSTGANNPWLRRYVQPDDGRIGTNPNNNHHNRAGDVCAHAYIGKQSDGTVAVYQTLPWNMRCWLSGNGPNGNANRLGYIGFEICEDAKTDYSYFIDAMTAASMLTAYLCQTYGIDPETGVRDHSELHDMGLASNHSDIGHWTKLHGESMDTFRGMVMGWMVDGVDVEYIDCDEV